MSAKSNIILKMLVDQKERVYHGRFIGFLKDDEFNALVQKAKDLAHRIESKETQSIIDLARSNVKLPGTRLVMAIRKRDDETVIDKKLFVSPRCDYTSSISNTEVVIELMDNNNSMVIEEEAHEE